MQIDWGNPQDAIPYLSTQRTPEGLELLGRAWLRLAEGQQGAEPAATLETARRHAVLSVLNPAPVDARALVLAPLADLMTPNEIELERLTGVAGQDDAALREGLGRLIAAGAGRALATLGRNGAAALIDGELIRVPAFAVAAVDAVGAGDVYNAALISRLVSGDPLPAAMRFAAAAAAISVTRPGADCAPSPAEVAAFLAKV